MTNRSKQTLFFLIMYGGLLCCFVVIYVAAALYRTRSGYEATKQNWIWSETAHIADAELGYRTKPGVVAVAGKIEALKVPIRHDENGFRVPSEGSPAESLRPLVLSLGCSFTYGQLVKGEDTFTYRVARALNGSAINAGISGHGIAQMLLIARKIIPRYRPDYVIAQYSPWLLERSLSPFAPTVLGKLPTPYFYEKDGHVQIAPPVYLPVIWTLPIHEYAETPRSFSNYLSFFGRVGLPLTWSEDTRSLSYRLRSLAGAIPAPASGIDAKIISEAYDEIATLARENGAKMVVAIVGDATRVPYDRQAFPNDSLLADTNGVLLDSVHGNAEGYRKAYHHWYGSSDVDGHPNKEAHRIIAETITNTIRAERPRKISYGTK